MNDRQLSESISSSFTFKHGIWLFGASAILVGIADRSIAAYSDGYLSSLDVMQLSLASVLLLAWLYMKPRKITESNSVELEF